MIRASDEESQHLFRQQEVSLKRSHLIAGEFEVAEEVHASLIALDRVGKPAVIPFLEGDDFGANLLELVQDMLACATKIAGRGLGKEEHALVNIDCDFRHSYWSPPVSLIAPGRR